MKSGTIIRSFTGKDGRTVTLRAPTWSDLDDFLEHINSLIEEGAEICSDKKIERNAEIDWLAKHLSAVEKDEKICVVAEVDGRFVGQVTWSPKTGRQRHVGVLGISVRSGYRDIGIGAELMKEAETQARRLGLKIMTLEVFASNNRARHVYEKAGYRVVGRIPKAILKDGEYVDSIVMIKDYENSLGSGEHLRG